jgi:hypothetical protein
MVAIENAREEKHINKNPFSMGLSSSPAFRHQALSRMQQARPALIHKSSICPA